MNQTEQIEVRNKDICVTLAPLSPISMTREGGARGLAPNWPGHYSDAGASVWRRTTDRLRRSTSGLLVPSK